jgi:lipopolysaccharide transport system ATP-binding protein
MRDAIVVENVSKRYFRRNVHRPHSIHEALLRGWRGAPSSEAFWGLRNVSFTVQPGTMLGVMGRNGAGKSTLLRLLGGVDTPDEGAVQTLGRVGDLLTLGAGFHSELTGRENVFICGVVNGLTRAEVRKKFDEIVAFAEVEEFVDSPLRIYSSGMAMRLRFAVAIHMQPDILLIDEVLAVGDAAFQDKCLARIRQFKASGCTIVLVSHGFEAFREMCDQALWLNAGQIAAFGTPQEVISQYAHTSGAKSPNPPLPSAAVVSRADPAVLHGV